MKRSVYRGYVAASTVALAILVAVPLAAVASNRFSDVPDADVFHGDIDWLADAAITLGCNPPANDEFCPSAAVTREQMAAFMRRFATYLDAADGTPAEADNASTLDGLDSTDFIRGDNGKMGYVWACAGTDPALYDALTECGGWVHNSSGGSVTVDRIATGRYSVVFSGLGSAGADAGGNVEVTTYGTIPAHCQVTGWSSSGPDVSIGVWCFDLAAAPADSDFDVLFVW